jgi:hypothetical protein
MRCYVLNQIQVYCTIPEPESVDFYEAQKSITDSKESIPPGWEFGTNSDSEFNQFLSIHQASPD